MNCLYCGDKTSLKNGDIEGHIGMTEIAFCIDCYPIVAGMDIYQGKHSGQAQYHDRRGNVVGHGESGELNPGDVRPQGFAENIKYYEENPELAEPYYLYRTRGGKHDPYK